MERRGLIRLDALAFEDWFFTHQRFKWCYYVHSLSVKILARIVTSNLIFEQFTKRFSFDINFTVCVIFPTLL